MKCRMMLFILYILLSTSGLLVGVQGKSHDYVKAIDLTFQFFEAQRSGYLPTTQRAKWRANSGLEDGKLQGVDLIGGYYDAGDNVKFQFPMAFTITTLAWGTIEYRDQLEQAGQLQNALDAIKWGTDYFIKAHPEDNVLWVQVGEGENDHQCWMRPEDMTTKRTAFKIDANHPGSDVAAETAAAMAAASIVFRFTDETYANILLNHARKLFNFADKHRGKYDDSVTMAKNFYASISGYNDELLWGALWLFEGTGDEYYLREHVVKYAYQYGGIGWTMNQYGWDSKYSGVHVLASKILMEGRGGAYKNTLRQYQIQAEAFMCSALGKNSGGRQIERTKGGLFFSHNWNNMQYVTAASFLVTVYADYMLRTDNDLKCSGNGISASELLDTSKEQMDYMLGSNELNMSYMVGYGEKYPRFVHHRGASIISIWDDSSFVACGAGYYNWFHSHNPDPNIIMGAIVGGPNKYDQFTDTRSYVQSGEPATYNSGSVVGILARMAELSR